MKPDIRINKKKVGKDAYDLVKLCPMKVFDIEDICKIAKKYSETETYYGTTNGGTTIQLPFGFVQWHQEQLQFHHQYWKINDLLSR